MNSSQFIDLIKNKLDEAGIVSPLSASYEITKQCNLRCKHCYNYCKSEIDGLSTDKKIQAIESVRELGIIELTICGGEPFMAEDLFIVLRHAKASGFKVWLLTNGILLDDCAIEQLDAILTENDVVQFSVDDPLNKDFSGQRNLSLKLKNTLKLNLEKSAKCKYNSIVNITPTKMNQNVLFEIVLDVTQLGISTINATPFVKTGRARDLLITPDYGELLNQHRKIEEYAKLNSINYLGGVDGAPCQSFNKFPKLERPKQVERRSCDAGSYNIHINSVGDIFPCVFLEQEKFNAGNILKDDLNIIRKNIAEMSEVILQSLPSTCSICEIAPWCGGGCPGVIWDAYHNLEEVDPRCRRCD